MSFSELSEHAEAFARRHVRHNVLALGVDFALFFVGLSFASQLTILPAFAAHLGAPNVVIGAIPALMSTGWLLPSLFAAGHTETLQRKLPFVLRYSIWERLPFLGLAAAAFILAERAPALTLAVLLLMLVVITAAGGALMPAWMDIVGRAVPVSARGRFFAFATVLGNTGGVFGSFATAWILATAAAPASYGFCFLGASVFMALSYVALALTREPPSTSTTPAVPLTAYLRRVAGVLRRDRNLAWFLVARACGSLGMMAGGFYTVYSLRRFQAADWQVGVFTTLVLVGEIVGTLVLGWLADRAGHRLVVIIGAAAALAGNLLALAAPSLDIFRAAFALQGLQLAALHVSGLNILLEFAPSVGARPTYVGLGNTLTAPVAFVAPLGAGLLADTLGFPPVFLASALGGFAALAVLLGCVRDPRHTAAAEP
ncbi:MAG TPA: MFS transporter [Methylomirabilota bacterium]|nr:MFS transporter [Methylomirabilota bacterium]